jgi:Flp pilus assembly pilin Flp
MKRPIIRGILRGSDGQTVVEYLLTTVLLVTIFTGMFGVLQSSLKKLFLAGGMVILTPRPY